MSVMIRFSKHVWVSPKLNDDLLSGKVRSVTIDRNGEYINVVISGDPETLKKLKEFK